MWHYKIKNNNSTRIVSNTYALKITLLLIFVTSTLLVSLTISSVNVSAKTNSQMNVDEQTNTYMYYNALTKCADYWKLSKTNFKSNVLEVADANKFNWFENPVVFNKSEAEILKPAGYIIADDDLYDFVCGNNEGIPWISDAMTSPNYWGYANGVDAVCEFGLKRWKPNQAFQEVDCKSGKDSSGNVNEDSHLYQANLSGKMDVPTMKKSLNDRMGKPIVVTNPIKYKIYLNAFEKSCGGQEATAADGDKTYTIEYVDNITGDLSKKIYAAAYPPSQKVAFYYSFETSDTQGIIVPRTKTTCEEIAKTLGNKTLAETFAVQLKANLKNPEIEKEPDGLSSSGGAEDKGATCGSTLKLVGWIMCPVINGLALLNDGMWNVVSELLTVDPLKQSDDIYKAWSFIRNLANIAFAIVFLITILSQTSSIGISNYGIKKLLPRLIVCAVLVNISFFIVQVAVDLSNIAGSSIYNILQNLTTAVGSDSASMNIISGVTLVKLALNAVAGTAGIFGTLFLVGGSETLLWIIFPVIVMAALAFIAAMFTLIFRTAAIPILAILAPLAFVAYLLPNTESWFKKWKDMFVKMLMLYPLAALLFGGARFAAFVTIGTGEDVGKYIIGTIIMALPLFALPFLAKQGGEILNKVNGALMGLAEKARNPLKGYSKGREDLARSKYLASTPKSGVRGIVNRKYRNRVGRRMTREMDTETNNANFKNEWAAAPEITDDNAASSANMEAKRKLGNGWQAQQRSIESKKQGEIISTKADTYHSRSIQGQNTLNKLGEAKLDAEKQALHTEHRVAQQYNGLKEDIDIAKKENERQTVDRLNRVNASHIGKGLNDNINTGQLRAKELAGESEHRVAGSVAGMALNDSIYKTQQKSKVLSGESAIRVDESAEGQSLSDAIYKTQQRAKELSGESAVRVDSTDDGKAISDSINTTQLAAQELAGESEERVWGSAIGQTLHDSIGLTKKKIEDHSLKSEARVIGSDEGQRLKQSMQSSKTKIQTAENTAANKYENNQETMPERLELRESKENLAASEAATNQMVEEMSVMETDEDGNFIIERDQFGDAVLDQYGNEKTVPVYTPTMNNMTTPAGYMDNREYFNEKSRNLAGAKRETTISNAAENSATKYVESQFNKAVAHDEDLARTTASVHGASRFGGDIAQARAMESESKASRDVINAFAVKHNDAGYGNRQFNEMITTGHALVNDAPPGQPPNYVVDPANELSSEEYSSALESLMIGGYEPFIRNAIDAVNIVPPNETPAQRDIRMDRQKTAAAIIKKMPNKMKWIGKSLGDRMATGMAGVDEVNPTTGAIRVHDDSFKGSVLYTVAQKKYSPGIMAGMGNDEMQGMSIVCEDYPIANDEDYEGRRVLMDSILAIYEDDMLRNSLSVEQKTEHDRLLNLLDDQCRDYATTNTTPRAVPLEPIPPINPTTGPGSIYPHERPRRPLPDHTY